jgi:predicted acetyltransferase
VLYRRRHAWDNGFPRGELVVVEMMTASLDAYTSLWRFLLGVDLIETVTFNRYALGDPLPWLVDEPRQLRVMALWDDVWMRLVDVAAALGARRYLTEDRLVLDVVDTFRPVAGGRFALDGGPDGAECRPTTTSADLGLDVGTLGSLYLGGHRPSALARAGRIDELTPGALRRADAFFASDPPPHNQTAF